METDNAKFWENVPENLRDIIWWNPTKFNIASSCLKKYFFEYIKKEKVPIPNYFALGTFLHRKMELLYRGSFGNLEVAYKSAESFYRATKASWIRDVINSGEVQGKKIEWRDKKEPWESIGVIKEICYKAYERYLMEGVPLDIEIPIKFELNGSFFRLRVDELRKGAIIRDHKTGKFFPGEYELNYLPQLTMYALAVSCKAYSDREFAAKFGITQPEKLLGNPHYISPEIKTQYFHMRTSEIITRNRTDEHYNELVQSLDDL